MNTTSPPGLYADTDLAKVLMRVSSALSIAGALFIIVSHVLFRDLRKFSRKLIAYLAIADIGAAGAWLAASFLTTPSDDIVGDPWGGGGSTIGCFVQGILMQFFMLSSALWTSCFAFHLYLVIWCYNKVNDPTRMECTYRAIAWGIPLLTVAYLIVVKFIPSVSHISIGPGAERPWCWIENDGAGTGKPGWEGIAGTVEEFALFYAPAFVAFMVNVVVYTFLYFKVHEVSFFSSQPEAGADEHEERQRAKRERAMNWRVRRRLLMYLAVFIITSSFGFAGRVYQIVMAIVHKTHVSSPQALPPRWLILVDATLGPLQGCLNALVYGVNPQLCQQYSNKVRLLCARICGDADGRNGPLGATLSQYPEDEDYEAASAGGYPMGNGAYHQIV